VLSRRHVLTLTAAATLAPWFHAAAADDPLVVRFRALEQALNGRLGVLALNVETGCQVGWRAGERFPVCSTFKWVLAAAVLHHYGHGQDLLRRISYGKADMVAYSPISEQHMADGMTLGELCAAAVQYSDNTAANLLLREVGGPAGLTAFARERGDQQFRLDRWEPELNTAIPGDPRDTSTASAMAHSLHSLLLGNGLADAQRRQLTNWMLGNTTGNARIRAGMPKGWAVADKTGTGAYASASDVGMVWPTQGGPVAIAIYTSQPSSAKAAPRDDIIAGAAKVIVDWVKG
jgi:beta-lactamase class A